MKKGRGSIVKSMVMRSVCVESVGRELAPSMRFGVLDGRGGNKAERKKD